MMRKLAALTMGGLLIVGMALSTPALAASGTVVVDLVQSLDEFLGAGNTDWSFTTIAEDGKESDGLQYGSEFYPSEGDDNDRKLAEMLPGGGDQTRRPNLVTHPAWNGAKGWAVGRVSVDLPRATKLMLSYYPGKVRAESDGITLTVFVDKERVAYNWVTGKRGWRPESAVDLTKYAGKTVDVSFQVGWGKEERGKSATPSYDSFIIGSPVISAE